MVNIKKETRLLTKILIIEDDLTSGLFIKSLVKKFFAKKKVSIFWEKTLVGAESFLLEKEIDLVLLDLNLDGEDGFSIAESLIHMNTQIIIISGITEKAIEAFKYSILDFVPKPIDENRFFSALEKFQEKSKWNKKGQYLFCKQDEEIKLIPFSQITYIKGEGKKTLIFVKKGEPVVLKKNLNAVNQSLPENFYRIHKSYITRLEYIHSIKLQPETVAVLKNKQEIPISRRMLSNLQDTLK